MIVLTKAEARETAARVEDVRRQVKTRIRNLSRSIPRAEREEAKAILGAQENALMFCVSLLTGIAKIEK